MPKVSKKSITVIIPTRNRSHSLTLLLKSLTNQEFKDFKVLIVDGGSNDGTLKVVTKFSQVLDIVSVGPISGGLVNSMNAALSVVKTPLLVRTDDDVVAKPTWLKAIVNTFDSDGSIGGVTGPTVIPTKNLHSRDLFTYTELFKDGGLIWKLIGDFYFKFILDGKTMQPSLWCKSGAFTLGSNYKSSRRLKTHLVTNLEACNFAVKTEILKKVGGFDSAFTGIGEYNEADVVFKIRKMGYKLMFNPRAEVNHCPSQQGFFDERPDSFPRISNFIFFYLRHYDLKNIDNIVHFFSYLIFQNCYYLYQALAKRQIKQLGSILGTFHGFYRSIASGNVR